MGIPHLARYRSVVLVRHHVQHCPDEAGLDAWLYDCQNCKYPIGYKTSYAPNAITFRWNRKGGVTVAQAVKAARRANEQVKEDAMLINLETLSAKTARDILASAIEEAERLNLSIAVVVADLYGQILASARMDKVSPPVLGFAEDKAYTSATMKRSTEAFAERMGSSPSLTMGLSTRSRLLVWGGGLPIFHNGKVVGGLGVSGAKDFEDIAIGKYALQRYGFSWEA